MSDAHNAVVLAAGGSRRLGYPKQLLTRDGEALVHRSVRLSLHTRPQRLLLICGGEADAIAASVHDLRVEIVINPDWQEGLASSLRLAACALTNEALPCLILGCDQPALHAGHLQALIEGARARGCAATLHGASRGVPALVPAALLAGALQLQGDRGLRGLLNALPDEEVAPLQAPELEWDLDTGADVDAARARGWLD